MPETTLSCHFLPFLIDSQDTPSLHNPVSGISLTSPLCEKLADWYNLQIPSLVKYYSKVKHAVVSYDRSRYALQMRVTLYASIEYDDVRDLMEEMITVDYEHNHPLKYNNRKYIVSPDMTGVLMSGIN